MSADNGIYILKTLTMDGKWEYRVKHLQAVENYRWDFLKPDEDGGGPGGYTEDTKWHIYNAKRIWMNCKVYHSHAEAYVEAAMLHEDIGYTEYGITEITIPECWDSAATITNEGVIQLQMATAFLLGQLDPEKWSSELNGLDTRLSNYVTYRLQLRDNRLELQKAVQEESEAK